MSDRERDRPNASEPLGFIVAGEARRMLSDAQIAADPERVAAGWVRRFIASGPRAQEMIQLYRELGFEVAADPIRSEQITGDCGDCELLMRLEFVMIYTRIRRPAAT